MEEIKRLTDKIKGTNNGYIFAPTGKDLKTAREYPEHFTMTAANILGSMTIRLKDKN